MLPSLFVSHGAPTLPLDDCPARQFISDLGQTLPRPNAILAVSAHWNTDAPVVNRVQVNETIHDFHGFPEALYRIVYPAPGSPELASRVAEALEKAGFRVNADDHRGLDHGAWVPLLMMYPEHDIPVVQLSIQSPLGPAHHLNLGRALVGLRDDVLVLCTGSFTHNLRLMDRSGLNAPEPQWVGDFSNWIHSALVEHRTADLLNYRILAPFAARAHPDDDHFMPLFVALGASTPDSRIERLHSSTTFGTLRMDAYAFS
jgi:4,5-DOPA dioxygenase extradiol